MIAFVCVIPSFYYHKCRTDRNALHLFAYCLGSFVKAWWICKPVVSCIQWIKVLIKIRQNYNEWFKYYISIWYSMHSKFPLAKISFSPSPFLSLFLFSHYRVICPPSTLQSLETAVPVSGNLSWVWSWTVTFPDSSFHVFETWWRWRSGNEVTPLLKHLAIFFVWLDLPLYVNVQHLHIFYFRYPCRQLSQLCIWCYFSSWL